jgi:hypothetical protein
MKNKESLYIITKALPVHLPFIYNSFVRSKTQQDKTPHIRRKEYKCMLEHTFGTIMSNDKTECFVACDPEDPSQLFGWIAFIDDNVIWAHVKLAFRKKYGLAQSLFDKFENSLDKGKTRYFLFYSNYYKKKKVSYVQTPAPCMATYL